MEAFSFYRLSLMPGLGWYHAKLGIGGRQVAKLLFPLDAHAWMSRIPRRNEAGQATPKAS